MEKAINTVKDAVLAVIGWIEVHPGYALTLWVLSVAIALAV